MSIKDLAYRIAHRYPGGVPALAVRMNMSKHVLQNKVNIRCDTHRLTAEELDMMTDFADTDETAQYFCAKRNMVGIHLPEFDNVSDRELLDLFLTLDKARGDLSDCISKALSDGMIDPGEFERIDGKIRTYGGVMAEVRNRLKSMVQERRHTSRDV
jgi:hypothetical protein